MVQEEISRTTLALMMRVGRFTERELMAAISNIGKGNGGKKEGTKPGRSKTYGELKTEAPGRWAAVHYPQGRFRVCAAAADGSG